MPAPKEVAYYAPIFEVVYEAFGEDRVIYGSNWPVTMRGGTYGEYLAVVKGFFADKRRAAREKFFFKNALKFYGLPALK